MWSGCGVAPSCEQVARLSSKPPGCTSSGWSSEFRTEGSTEATTFLRTENIGDVTLTRSCRNLLCIIMLRKFVGSVVRGSGIGWSNVSFHTKIFYSMSWFEFTTLVYWPCDAVNLCTSPFESEPSTESSSLRLLYLSASPWTGDVPAMTDKSLLDLLQ